MRQHTHSRPHQKVPIHLVPAQDVSRADALKALGPCMYAFRITRSGVIKIGWTSNLCGRERTLRTMVRGEVELLAVLPGATHEDELKLHAGIDDSNRHSGREYYLPTEPVISIINGWRARVGHPLIAS